MNLHLSEQELFDCITVGAIKEQSAHLAACAQCSDELERKGTSLAQARVALSDWAMERQDSDTAFIKRMREKALGDGRRRTLQVSAATLLLLVVPAGVIQQRRAEQRAHQADEVLLRQVDEAISETVPDAMQPLSKLIVWNEDGKTEQSSGTQQKN